MTTSRGRFHAAVSLVLLIPSLAAAVGVLNDGLPTSDPSATIDLTTTNGTDLVRGQWRYADVKIVEVPFKAPDAEGQPMGPANRTYDIDLHAGGIDFDDSSWVVVEPTKLDERRGHGRMSFAWYRNTITIPPRIGEFDPGGSTVVFETSVDDYAEVWVDGELPRALGQSGGSVIKGWNAPNRLVIGRNVKPGQKIQLAVFGMNGPISNPVTNFIWMRSARLDFYATTEVPIAVTPQEVNVEVVRLDPAIDAIVPRNAKAFKLAEGFQFTEGPVWVPDGFLLFSDPNANRIYKYTADGDLSVFKEKSGYSGADESRYRQPGSNGLTLDRSGRLTINEHGNRRVTLLDDDSSVHILAERFEGKRFNSPNDLVYHSSGALYFTDPPFGLPNAFDDPGKELAYSGVYRVADGRVELLDRSLTGPNGIAFSPDETFLYVGDWDPQRKVLMRYEVEPNGRLSNGRVFFDMTDAAGEDALDGVKVDTLGNLYVSGPGGLWIISAAGKHLGTIVLPKHPHNLAWGDADGRTLYLCARSSLYRMRLNIAGVHP